jgi:hypothetical protein
VKQDVVDHGLVLVRDGRDLLGHGEDDVEIRDRQQFGLPVLQPLRASKGLTLWAMAIAATVERDALVAAVVALIDVAAKGRGAAALHVAHDAPLPRAERSGVFFPVSRADLAKNVRHLEPVGSRRHRQKTTGGRGWGSAGSIRGNRSKGLIVAHTVEVGRHRQQLCCHSHRVQPSVLDQPGIPQRVQVRPAPECLELVRIPVPIVGIPGVQRLVNIGDQVDDVLEAFSRFSSGPFDARMASCLSIALTTH